MNINGAVCCKLARLFFACVIVLLSACYPAPTPTAIPPTTTRTSTRIPTRTSTPTLPPNTPTKTPTATPTPSPILGSTADILRVRSGPSTDSPVLARLDPGTTLFLFARSSDGKWLQVEYPPGSDQRAWVSAEFVKLAGSVADLPVAQNTLTPTPTLAMTLTPTIPPVTPTVGPSDSALELFNRTNFIREANNLEPYKWSEQIAASAKRHSQDMAKTGKIDHTGSDNSTTVQRIAETGYAVKFSGENIFGGMTSLDDVWNYWFDDETHRANLLNENFVDVGIGVIESAGRAFYTIDFAQPLPFGTTPTSAPPTPTATATLQVVDPCSPIPNQEYGTLQLLSGHSDPPAEANPDLNLSLRSYAPANASEAFIDLEGVNDLAAPQLRGLFVGRRLPITTRAYQVFGWDWSANGKGPLIHDPPVTMLGLRMTTGEPITTPRAGGDIGESYAALVLYADANRITLKYTREDHVVNGYTLHIENICVEPNLSALYQKLTGPKRKYVPALRAGQPFGRAASPEIIIAIRNKGNFMDPRSRKDWWASQ